jgi:hypothetical protein
MSQYIPSEENLAKIIAGEIEDPLFMLSSAALQAAVDSKSCRRDGRPLGDRDNPRHPGLNRELFCSCGFATTT